MSTPAPAFQLPLPAGPCPRADASADSPRSVASDGDGGHKSHFPAGRPTTLTSFVSHTSGDGPQRRFADLPASTTVSYRPCDDYSQSVNSRNHRHRDDGTATHDNNINNNNNNDVPQQSMSMTQALLVASSACKLAPPPPPPLALSLGGLPQPTDDFEGLDDCRFPPVSVAAGESLLPPAVVTLQRRPGCAREDASPEEYRPFEVPSQRSGADSVIADSSPHPRSVALRSDEDASESTTDGGDDVDAPAHHPRHRELPPPPPKGSVLGGLPLGSGAALPVALPPSVLSQLGVALPRSLLPPPRHYSASSAQVDFSDSDSETV